MKLFGNKALVAIGSIVLISSSFLISACTSKEITSSPKHTQHPVASAQATNNSKISYQWTIRPSTSLKSGQSIPLTFEIKDLEGNALGKLATLHEKMVHLIVVSKDLKHFQHVHPDVLNNGEMKIAVIFPVDGEYFLYLQFQPVGRSEQTLKQTLKLGNESLPSAQLIDDTATPKNVNGYEFKISNVPKRVKEAAMVTYEITKQGHPVSDIQPYLGAGGHAVLLSEDGQSFLHVHPMTEAKGKYYASPLQFHTEIDQPGNYKMWLQVKINNKVETVDFSFPVQ